MAFYAIGGKLSSIQLVVGIELEWLSGRNTVGVDDEVGSFAATSSAMLCVSRLHLNLCCNSPYLPVSLPNAILIQIQNWER
jgi:hypothetical protein